MLLLKLGARTDLKDADGRSVVTGPTLLHSLVSLCFSGSRRKVSGHWSYFVALSRHSVSPVAVGRSVVTGPTLLHSLVTLFLR